MKTAISLPDDMFEKATRRAHELGISRSEFFAQAAQRYLEVLDRQTLTQEIDAALDAAGTDGSAVEAVTASRRFLNSITDDW